MPKLLRFAGTPFLWVCGWELAECLKPAHSVHAPFIAAVAGLVGVILAGVGIFAE